MAQFLVTISDDTIGRIKNFKIAQFIADAIFFHKTYNIDGFELENLHNIKFHVGVYKAEKFTINQPPSGDKNTS